MIALDIEKFQDLNTFLNNMDELTQNVKACGEEGKIFMLGRKRTYLIRTHKV